MLLDPDVVNLHRVRRLDGRLSGVVKDEVHRRGSNPGGHASDVVAVIIIGNDPGLPVRGEGMPAPRVYLAGAAGSVAGAYTIGRMCRVMEVRAHIAVDAFGDVDFTVRGPVMAIGPHARPVGDIVRVPGRPGQPYPGLDETVREVELAVRAYQASGVLGGYAAALALLGKRQAQRPAALGDLGGVVTVIFGGADRRGNAGPATPAGRPLGRIQAGAVELIVELERPVAGHAGRRRRTGGRAGGRCLECPRDGDRDDDQNGGD